MSGAISLVSGDPRKAALSGWRQRGFTDGSSGRKAFPPTDDPEAASAYRRGHRRGVEISGR